MAKYRDNLPKIVHNLALLGMEDGEIARIIGVSRATLDKWVNENDDFAFSLLEGRELADAQVAARLFQRAMGYEHTATKIAIHAQSGAYQTVDYVQRYAPDTAAAIFWLKNRQPDKWKDKSVHENEFNMKDVTPVINLQLADNEPQARHLPAPQASVSAEDDSD